MITTRLIVPLRMSRQEEAVFSALSDYEPIAPTFIQKWALRLLKGLRLTRRVACDRFADVEIDHNKLFEAVRLSQHELAAIWGHRATDMIVGRKVLSQMANEPLSRVSEFSQFSFDFQSQIALGDQNRLLGITVHFVPWIEGWALLPAQLTTRKARGELE